MLTTIEGIYRNGHVELQESPRDVEEAKVIVTFLPAPQETKDGSTESNRRTLALLEAWRQETLSEKEAAVLDDFDAFQAVHPLTFGDLRDADSD